MQLIYLTSTQTAYEGDVFKSPLILDIYFITLTGLTKNLSLTNIYGYKIIQRDSRKVHLLKFHKLWMQDSNGTHEKSIRYKSFVIIRLQRDSRKVYPLKYY